MTEEAIYNHKRLWNRVVALLHTLSEGKYPPLSIKEMAFTDLFGDLEVKNDCFLCEEVYKSDEYANLECRCPLLKDGQCAMYNEFVHAQTTNDAINTARRIANVFDSEKQQD